MRRLLLSFAFVLVPFACGDLKSGGGPVPDAGPTNDASGGDTNLGDPQSDSGRDDASLEASLDAGFDSGRGAGPHGSLPTGFCCTSDAECRFRHCETVGTQHMCIEECDNPEFCSRPDLKDFTCASSSMAAGTFCTPPDGFVCLDPQTYVRGTDPVGGCCAGGLEGTNDGTAGANCESNECTATGNGPLICTIICAFQSDCPGGYLCNPSGNVKLCVRPTENYTCE